MKALALKKIRSNSDFKIGIKSAGPIFMGYFPIAVTFGLIIKSANLPGYMALLMSMTNFTGATQFISTTMLLSGASPWNILLTTFMINARYFLMSLCVANKLPRGISTRLKGILAFGITDEVFVLAMTKKETNINFILGSQLMSWLGWVGGTLVGIVAADFLPGSILASTGIAIYIMFLGLILPAAKDSKEIAVVTLVGILISSIFFYIPVLKNLVGNWRVIIAIILTSAIGAVVFPVKEDEDGN
ncbi:AzlC family ABC transporter permease [uncultured Ilyobacter sp.]|uniref:AzlC family ABC transporter permease n=1 Tax=uncultured Ilyobacter sp. TaxID=544433 RepID=UPI002AA9172C|nr:AzlC family ABC transporter permease [uncultured Ilyobacter sp.]